MREVLHRPVMVEEVLGFLLEDNRAGVYVDCTLGSGGHTEALLQRCADCVVIGIDQDRDALLRAQKRLLQQRVIFVHGRFSEVNRIIREAGYEEIDGALMDLGLSMEQIKDPERGFSFNSDAPVDMRMDRTRTLTAHEIINKWPEREIERIIRCYGQDRRARTIARRIVHSRPVNTCRQLAEIVLGVYGARKTRIHPATRTFQALRIAVNSELEELQKGLRAVVEVLRRGARVVVISYHSLEDRVVKNFFRDEAKRGVLRILTKKVIRPTQEEIRNNPPSRSAKLRAAERC